MDSFTIKAPIARRMPDPYPTEHPVVRHIMYVPVASFPSDLADRLEPNARNASSTDEIGLPIRYAGLRFGQKRRQHDGEW